MPNSVIIVAGGSGTRMGLQTPKQFLLLAKKPVLMHTIERFYEYDNNIEIIIALPAQEIDRWNDLCLEHDFKISHKTVSGGACRFLSVSNALEYISNNALVAVHDGVRPFVQADVIERCFTEAKKTGAVIPVVSLADSVRYIGNGENKAVNRDDYKLVQTPQVFKADVLKKAYKGAGSTNFTDDASVVEANGIKVSLVEGSKNNIKITTKEDLDLARLIISK